MKTSDRIFILLVCIRSNFFVCSYTSLPFHLHKLYNASAENGYI